MFAALLVRQASKLTRIQISSQSIRLGSRKARRKILASQSSDGNEEVRTSIFQEDLRNVILQQAVVDWEKIRDEAYPKIAEQNRHDFRGTFATAVFLALASSKDFAHLRQFVEHVGLDKLGVSHIVKYMTLCNDPDEIVRCWEHFKSRKCEFTELQAKQINMAMLRTPEWRQSLKLIDPRSWKSMRRLATLVANKHFENFDFDAGIELLKSTNGTVGIGNYADPVMEDRKAAERFLGQMTAMETFIDPEYDPSASTSWNKHFTVKQAFISRRMCSNCRTVLPVGELSLKDFEKLRAATLAQVVHQGDIYLTSTQEEFEKFQSFIKENGPFDAVIDGLNLLYRFEKPRNTAHNVCQEYFDRGCKRLLILMRHHVSDLFKKMNLPAGVQFYIVENVTRDDPYLLLAALMSHSDCRMLTADFFRDHMFKLKKISQDDPSSNVYNIFQKWYLTRKDHCLNKTLDNRAHWRSLRVAPQHFLIPHADPRGWHFPVQFIPGVSPKWFCIRRKRAELLRE